MKIKTLTLNNFRAFPGPEAQTFTLDGKNLLVYGENGSGKSSLYYALKTFFSLNAPNAGLETRNVFSQDTNTWSADQHWIEVEFDDGLSPARWIGTPPITAWPHDARVREAARRRGCLDYRALLDTNYRHFGGDINLFEIAVDQLLSDFQLFGSPPTIGKLWADVLAALPRTNRQKDVKPAEAACEKFNSLFGTAVNTVFPMINELLPKLAAEGVQLIRRVFSNVVYDKINRNFANQKLTPEISFLNYPLSNPHVFLNEARLSAIGLAMYLAGRLTCVPTGDNALKLLVLDDVLIGMDLSNRLPLLDLLRERFQEWQIVLLTHDKTWYDMAKFHVEDSGTWASLKMFEGAAEGSFSVPIVVQENESTNQIALNKATEFSRKYEYQAAANYARAAFEGALKRFCEKRSVPVTFKSDLRELKIEMLLEAIDLWVKEEHRRIFYTAALERTKLFRRIILNPLSHADAPAVKYEVEGAIEAVKKLDEVLTQKPPQNPELLQDAEKIANKVDPSPSELHIGLTNLRASFVWKLRQFCELSRIDIPFSIKGPDVVELWNCVHASGPVHFAAIHLGLEIQIDAERSWLADEVSLERLQQLTQADLLRLIAILKQWL